MIDYTEEEEDVQIEECKLCGGDIIIEGFSEEDDAVYCNDCEAEYLIVSLDPIRLQPLDEGEDEGSDFDDEYDD
ncbi:hypothetical protein JWJ90_06045 [Desulfobulbus rhabdoformis]|uniref:hypothetical protein n=1 Tax=Desulfobulbus rhabdoformis TaxID=34032 RepID=UPI0019656AAB|nr:hypothetical protein [Desulfobulbus rhabdoformis]MBM9613848.1 hypothetical protein [Desulfobulbus rhabdoformis]